MSFRLNIRQIFKPAYIYRQLKQLYYKLAPLGSRRYEITNSIIRRVLKRFQLLNIYYRKWLKIYDTLSEEEIDQIKHVIRNFRENPLISIVMPVYNPEVSFFLEAIDSVKNQLYPNWELCIADDASTNPLIPDIISNQANDEPRIKYILRKENGHISACSNSALSLAAGEYVALLDHDDLLHPLALYHVAKTINKHPNSGIIFSDEDKITKRGQRIDPYFKSEFDYELLLSQNMVSHLGVYRKDIIDKIGGFRLGLEGSQDYDLLLRAIEQIDEKQIHHIPKILYHWRISKHSVAESLNIKPYAIQAGERAINEHLNRKGIKGEAEFLEKTSGYRINYSLPDNTPSVALLVVGLHPQGSVDKLINEIISQTEYNNFQIHFLLNKNASEHNQILTNVKEYDHRIIPIELSGNPNNPQILNSYIYRSSADYIGFINPNLSGFYPGWLTTLVGQAMQENIGAVAPKILDPDHHILSNGIIFTPDRKMHNLFQGKYRDFNGYFGWGKLRKGFSALSEEMILLSRSKFTSIKGFETDYHLPSLNCFDLCLKLKENNFRNVLCPSIELYIDRDREYNRMRTQTELLNNQNSFEVFIRKWESFFMQDPGFNPNLTIAEGGEIVVNLSPQNNQSIGKDLNVT